MICIFLLLALWELFILLQNGYINTVSCVILLPHAQVADYTVGMVFIFWWGWGI